MGCDIHACIERKVKLDRHFTYWLHAGDPDINRNYSVFTALAGVRGYSNMPIISEPRGLPGPYPNTVNSQFEKYAASWEGDAHSHSYVTLAEMKAYDLEAEYDNESLVLTRDDTGQITSTCLATTGSHLGPVGRTKVFGPYGPAHWLSIIAKLETVRAAHELTDEDVRLVFFFDN